MATTTEYYDKAIAELTGYCQNERDGDKRDAANDEITSLVLAKQANAFDNMANRSAALNQAVTALQGIVDGAGDGPQIAESLDGINSLIADIQSVIEEQ